MPGSLERGFSVSASDDEVCVSDAEQEWIEVVVPAKVALVEGIASELVSAVAAAEGGVEVRKGNVVFWVHSPDLETALADVRGCLQRLAGQGWQVDATQVRAGNLAPEENWRDAWKKFFQVTRLTRQIVVVPSWEVHEPLATDIPIHLDPGQAFGTGAHASTQLVLETMQELVDSGTLPVPETVFDLGTGSGILAIAAAKFWPATRITATDIDPLSIEATQANASNNGVGEQIEVSTKDLLDVEERFPVVLANIQAHVLRGLRDPLLDRLLPDATLLLSGILTAQIQPLVDFYCESGVVVIESIRQSRLNSEWSSAHLRRAS
ncbi:MAG: methyltransferase [Myxococcales bacterium]|nr:methyltransferase [Myxococcales bacterium]